MGAMSSSEPADLIVENAVRTELRRLPSAIIALSGGVDSSVVAALSAQELGERALAVTGVSASLDQAELEAVRALCKSLGLRHEVATTQELAVPGYVQNAPNRCYFCKTELYSTLARVAKERGIAAILDGTTADDLAGHRPGKRAADEHAVLSPLVTAGATKTHVRAIARRLGLPTAERPSSPCLSSRIAYGVTVTPERLDRVGRAEAYLKTLGFTDVRVRLHDAIARVEVPKAELGRALGQAEAITAELKRLGFVYVTLDLAGLRSGSLLEALSGSAS
jgi:pyridinium-3,5-biscarboxylic acid mononucleotide sulfurtransferase